MNWWLFVYRPMKPALTQERLKETLHYDPETGVFTWRVSRGRVAAGSRAGRVSRSGYIEIRVDDRLIGAHRLAFLYIEGHMPSHEVDHIDRCPGNNAWANLRPATRAQNASNVGPRRNSSSGRRGVSWHASSGSWQAYGSSAGKFVFLGHYVDLEDAAEAARAWRADNYGEFAAA